MAIVPPTGYFRLGRVGFDPVVTDMDVTDRGIIDPVILMVTPASGPLKHGGLNQAEKGIHQASSNISKQCIYPLPFQLYKHFLEPGVSRGKFP